jgi:hypothetical protein
MFVATGYGFALGLERYPNSVVIQDGLSCTVKCVMTGKLSLYDLDLRQAVCCSGMLLVLRLVGWHEYSI